MGILRRDTFFVRKNSLARERFKRGGRSEDFLGIWHTLDFPVLNNILRLVSLLYD